MTSEAQKRAKDKYMKSVRRFTVDFPPAEHDLAEHLDKQPNKQAYIRDLIRADMNKDK